MELFKEVVHIAALVIFLIVGLWLTFSARMGQGREEHLRYGIGMALLAIVATS